MDSDSDDGLLLPSVAGFGALFSRVQQQAKVVAPVKNSKHGDALSTTSRNPFKKNEGGGSSKKKKTKSPEIQSALKSAVTATTPASSGLSKSTEDLLAEVNQLGNFHFPPKRQTERKADSDIPEIVFTSTTSRSLRSGGGGRTTGTNNNTSSTKSRGGRRGRGRAKGRGRNNVMQVTISSDEDEPSFDMSLENGQSEIFEVSTPPKDPKNALCSLRIRWKAELLRFQFTEETEMSKVRMEVAKKLAIRADNLVIVDGDTNEKVSDRATVGTIRFGKTLEVLEQVPNNNNNNTTTSTTKKIELDPNCIQLKVQGSGGYRERLIISMQRTTHIKQLIDDFKDKFQCHDKQFKLIFDGETADLDETPESLDLDGGEMFDIVEVI